MLKKFSGTYGAGVLVVGLLALVPVSARALEAGAFADNFHGTVMYTGNYDMQTAQPMRMPRGLTVESLLSAAQGSSSKDAKGTITIKLEINGQSVRGNYYSQGALGSGTLQGTRDGDVCTLTDRDATWHITCQPDHFEGDAATFDSVSPKVTASFNGAAKNVVDIAANEKAQQARAKEQAAAPKAAPIVAKAQPAPAAVAEAPAPVAGPAAGSSLTKKLEQIVEADSKGWSANTFDKGTVRNVHVVEGSAKSGEVTIKGDYKYNDGENGWVQAKLNNGKFVCVEFWDSVDCRPLMEPKQAQKDVTFSDIVTGMMNDDSSTAATPCQGSGCQGQATEDLVRSWNR